ncbi:MAG TPA: DUF2809 domain-containing protein [Bacillota bacterium]|nr:DUF2809 domain-containing protein [Bacillota bacterium]
MKSSKKRLIFAGVFALLLAAEVLIALYVHDSFVRPYGGDIIAVIALWCFMRIFMPEKISFLWLLCFVAAVALEISQYFGLADCLTEAFGLEKGGVLYTLLGSSFSWYDMLCYAAGTVVTALHDIKSSHREKEVHK